MTTWRRMMLAITCVALATGVVAPPSGAQDTSTPTAPSGYAPPGEEVVQSWALAPTGSLDPEAAGNRPNFSYEVDPGAVLEDSLTVFNYSNVQMTFRLYATDAFNNRDGQFDLLAGSKEPEEVGTWITLPQANLTVPAGTQSTLPFTITVPADARPGDHAGAIVASNEAPGAGPDGKVVMLDRRTGSRVYLRVAGPLDPELAIDNVKTTYTPALNPLGGTAKVSYRIQNRGNVRMGGSHSVKVSGPFGTFEKKVAAKDLPEVLPGEGVTLEATFDDVPATALLFTEVQLDPSGGDGLQAAKTQTRSGISLAAPITVVLLAISTWLALRARRAYRRHRSEDAVLEAHPA